MQLQTKDEVRRGVCFSAAKLSEFQSFEIKTSPVKLLNYDIDKSDNKSVLMGAKVRLFEMPVSFPKAVLKSNITLGSLSAVADNQLISLDAKVAQLQGRKKINTRFGIRDKVTGSLVDPHGATTIELWEDFIPQVQEGSTYSFKNLRVHKNQHSGTVFVATPNGSYCTITLRQDFSEPLATPTDLPDTFLTKTTEAEFIGVKTFALYFTCFNCNTKIADTTQVVTKCTKCGLTQKVTKCKKTCYVQALIEEEPDTCVTVTMFKDVLLDTLGFLNDYPLTEDLVTTSLLSLPRVKISYNRKTKIVISVQTS